MNNKRVIYYEINKDNTDSIKYANFIANMLEKLDENERKNTVIFADNASFHFGQKVIDTYKKYKCKVLFNTPYLSEFNCIELIFRYIKNIYYKHLYNSIEQLEEHIRSIIDNINEKLLVLYLLNH